MDFLSIFVGKNQQLNSPFDCLPNDVILVIFNKIQDAKTLIGSFSLNKRLASIIPQTDVVSLSLVIPHSSTSYLSSLSYSREKEDLDLCNSNNNNRTCGNCVNIVKSTVNNLITKLLRSCGNSGCGYVFITEDDNSISNDFPCQYLRPFCQLSNLHVKIHSDLPEIELPHYVMITSDDIFLWKATYGSELKTWTLLCCSVTLHRFIAGDWRPEQQRSLERHWFSFRMKRMQVCFEAAYARHRLVKEIVAQHPTLKTVTVTDAKREGRLSMSEHEIRDLRESLKQEEEEGMSERVVPKLLLKVWYTALLELPVAKCTWKGAMLIMIRPVDDHDREMEPLVEENGGDDGFDGDEEDKAMFAEAEKEIMISSKTVYHARRLRTTQIEDFWGHLF